jgi:hypothetical protein
MTAGRVAELKLVLDRLVRMETRSSIDIGLVYD